MKINDKGYVDWEEFLKNPNPVDISFIKEVPELAAPILSKHEEAELASLLENISKHLYEAIEEKQKQLSFSWNLRKWILVLLGMNGNVK